MARTCALSPDRVPEFCGVRADLTAVIFEKELHTGSGLPDKKSTL